jgi:myo-inositol-1(or 4)-monophosphatase
MDSFLINTIKEAGTIALDYFDQLSEIQIKKKGARDLVTIADVKVESFIRKKLLGKYPKHSFYGEESGIQEGSASRWIVDPIDGTHSFVRGQYYWSISIALEIEHELQMGAVYAPRLNDLYFAKKGEGAFKNDSKIITSNIDQLREAMVSTGFACLRSSLEKNNLERFSRIAENTMGQRRFGSAAMDLCMVADGQVDAFWEQHLNLYDIAAGVLIVKEAGGSITDFTGVKTINPEAVLATNSKLLDEILAYM